MTEAERIAQTSLSQDELNAALDAAASALRGVRLPGEGLGELRALSDAATPGPWAVTPSGIWTDRRLPNTTLGEPFSVPESHVFDVRRQNAADAAFVVALVNDYRLRALPGEGETPRPPLCPHGAMVHPAVCRNFHEPVRAGEGEEPRPTPYENEAEHIRASATGEHLYDFACRFCNRASEEPRPPQPDLLGWARWIVQTSAVSEPTSRLIYDHACAECVPGGPLVTDDFRCVPHEALAALRADTEGEST